MTLIEEYMKQTKKQRQRHIKLKEQCIERGGPPKSISTYSKGLMADYFDVTMPTGNRIYVCHACNNDKCSNPRHLYWGTAKENTEDRILLEKQLGKPSSIWEKMVAKYGLEEAKKRQIRNLTH